jgi:ubiquinone/menaquinone biosynthesis C-methylase UbiE
MKSAIFPELDKLYVSKNPFVRNLFWQRIRTAITFAEIRDDSILLDIGCGSGRLIKSIREISNKCECWAIDVLDSKIMENVSCKFQVADVRSLPFNDHYFDIIFVLDVLEHIKDDVHSAIRETHRVLKPGGLVILSGPTESIFYRFCRSLLFSLTKKVRENQETLEGHEIDFHYHTVHQLEQEFISDGFSLSRRKSLPGFPLPSLFQLSRFQLDTRR